MALIVEDGTGVTGAFSYVSLMEAETYIYDMPAATREVWDELDDNQREHLLAYATRILDQRARWHGNKTIPTSALRWPRKNVLDTDALPIGEYVIPGQLKAAVCDCAAWFAYPGRNPFTISDSQGIKEIAVDVLRVVYKDGHDATQTVALPPGLNATLRGLGTIQYGGNSSFAPISKA